MAKNMKGITFSMDALFALLIVTAFVPVLLIISFQEPEDEIFSILQMEAEDSIDVVSNLRIIDMRNEAVIDDLFNEGILVNADLNSTLLEIIGALWASDNITLLEGANNISKHIIDKLIPSTVEWRLTIENETIYNSSQNISRTVTIGKRVLSGVAKGKPSQGFLANAFIKGIDKLSSSYVFFGGFVGQGNISVNVSDIPSDANISSVYMEMDIGENFSLFINDNNCGIFNKTVSGASDSWTITSTSCLSSILPGVNNTIEMKFLGDSSADKFIGGGFIKIVYNTEQFLPISNITRHYIPGIVGAINYFDSFYIPGNLTKMNIHLEFLSQHDVSMLIGNTTVFDFTGSNSNETIDILDSELSTKLNYSELSKENIPIRLGATKQIQGFVSTGNADTIIITSTSGEMGNCDIRNGSLELCDADGNTTRLDAAKTANIDFAETILDVESNRVANIGYHNNAPDGESKVELTENLTILKVDGINKLNLHGNAQRCYACAIDEARRRLIPSDSTVPPGALSPTGPGSDYNKTRVILLMSDGNANFCDNKDDAVGDYKQNCGEANAKQQAIDQACLAANSTPYTVNESNITIHTIAFGTDIDNSTLIGIANCTGGKFFQSNNYTALRDIYRDIGLGIASVSFVQQAVNISGVGESTLYINSYINYSYVREDPVINYGEIGVTLETDKFPSCNGSFFIPSPLRVTDIKVTSYSADLWTSIITINDTVIFNLSTFSDNYNELGDPFKVQIPDNLIFVNRTNLINVSLALNSTVISNNCSSSNRVIYSVRFRASVPYGDVFETASGGVYIIYFDKNFDGTQDGSFQITIADDLPGFNPTPTEIQNIDPDNNAIENAVLRLLDVLNFVTEDGSGRSGTTTNPIDIELKDVTIDSSSITGIPFTWGPADFRIEVGI